MQRRAIAIQGTVQGVGFRPFVYGLASSMQLGGFVKNHTGGVQIEVEGESELLDQFVSRLRSTLPPLARIDALTSEPRPPTGERRFSIDPSEQSSSGAIVITPDAGTCDACLAELFDPRDRRYRYPFLNCTNCGPRLSIVLGAPYDRQRTTMRNFAMCPDCRREYEDPANRRFHAQPNACPKCGPRLTLLDAEGKKIETDDALAGFIESLRAGKIGAMKGLGGYHLVCDATRTATVAGLRRRKHRDEKPLAIMVRNLPAAELICEIDSIERELITSVRRPIVLLRKRLWLRRSSTPGQAAPATATQSENESPLDADPARIDHDQLAPGNPCLGVMLPYTPLHYLVLNDMKGVPLVMTSGNRSDEPIAYQEPEAIERLQGIADVFLISDRPIHVRCDDSVTRVVGGIEAPIRRSRGYAPQPIPLPIACPATILAVGGQLKATFALGCDRRAIISQHMGDLDHFEAYQAFERDVALYEQLFSLEPQYIAHDLHPDYASTRYANERTREAPLVPSPPYSGERVRVRGGLADMPESRHSTPSPSPQPSPPSTGEREQDAPPARHLTSIKTIAVQHHHAHMASCMAEHGLAGPVIGVTLDGTGFGTDGAIWGGEFLVGDYRSFRRAAHFRYVAMPGGESAVREPWRMAAAYLADAEATCASFESRFGGPPLNTIRKMLERKFNSPPTSSAGRLFDAVACFAGVRDRVSYEGQAAIELEWLATGKPMAGHYPFDLIDSGQENDMKHSTVIDTRPMIRAIAAEIDDGVDRAVVARKFHSTCVEIISAICRRIRQTTGENSVVLSGGVFMNALLTVEIVERLKIDGFYPFRHRLVPCNDGGLSLGQLAVAAAQLNSR